MDWEKTLWNLEIAVDDTTASGMAEAEINIPEDQEGALRFLCCQARVEEASAQPSQGQVQVEGAVAFTVLYETASGLASIESRNGFAHTVAMTKAQAGQRVQLKVTALSTQVRWINERQCRVECVLEMQIGLMERQERTLITGIQGAGVQASTTPIEGSWVIGTSRQVVTIREDVELSPTLPAAENVLWCQGQVELTQISCQAGQMDVAGQLRLNVLYSAAAPAWVEQTALQLPIAQQWDASEIAQSRWLMGEGRVQECRIKLYENIKGEKRVLAVEAQLLITVQGYASQQTQALTDAYSMDEEITLETQVWKIPGAPQQAQSETPVTGELKLPEGTALPGQVLQVLANPVVDSITVEQGKATITGRLISSVIHLSGEERMLGCINGTAPFETAVTAEGLQAEDWLQVEVAGLQAGASSGAAGSLQIRDVLEITLIWRDVQTQTVAVDGESEPWESELPSGLLLVVAQQDEDNWKMAKRCRIPMEELIQANPQLAQREVEPGECLVVERA